MSAPLAEAETVRTPASGRVSIDFMVPASGVWQLRRVTVGCTVSNPMPTAKVYRNFESPATLIGGTYTGSFDTASCDEFFGSGEHVVVVFEGAAPGSDCTANIGGTVENR